MLPPDVSRMMGRVAECRIHDIISPDQFDGVRADPRLRQAFIVSVLDEYPLIDVQVLASQCHNLFPPTSASVHEFIRDLNVLLVAGIIELLDGLLHVRVSQAWKNHTKITGWDDTIDTSSDAYVAACTALEVGAIETAKGIVLANKAQK